jgi:hypothetical protein
LSDFSIWLPTSSYPCKDVFIQEAGAIGVSLRIPRLVKGMIEGSSLLFVISANRIFACCVIDKVERVFDCPSAAKEHAKRIALGYDRTVVPVTPVAGGWAVDDKRVYGYRTIGGLYLSAYETTETIQSIADMLGGADIVGPLVLFPKEVYTRGKRFMSVKVVNRSEILDNASR